MADPRIIEKWRIESEALRAELAEAKAERDALLNAADMMRDEFLRIRAYAGSEIRGLCDRALADVQRRVPVLVELENATAERDKLRALVQEAVADRITEQHRPISEVQINVWLTRARETIGGE